MRYRNWRSKSGLIDGFDAVIIQRGQTHKRTFIHTDKFDIVEQILRTNEWAITDPMTDKLADTVICLQAWGKNTAQVIASLQQIFPDLTFE